VEDSLSALQELAKFHRKYLNLPIIALKVMENNDKELIHVVLSKNIGQKQRLVTSIIIRAFDVIILTAETEIGLLKWEPIIKMKLNFFANWLCLTMDILQILVKALGRIWWRCRCN
jgi:UDP-N-acetylmuramoyl-tripeptide--D-alanyl-D-alanine ligase